MIYKAEHSGTHTDAPAHFTEGSWRIGEIPIDRLVGPGVVIDIEKRARFKSKAMLPYIFDSIQDLIHNYNEFW